MHSKIISLLPAATEIVCALGFEQRLVGRSYGCDFPATVKQLPICAGAALPDDLILTDDLSAHSIYPEQIKQLSPDVLLTGVPLYEVEKALQNYPGKPVRIISLQANSIDDVFNNITTIAAALNAAQAADALLEQLHERVDIIRHKLKFSENKPTVACIERLAPLTLSGKWVPGLVNIAGGSAVLTPAGQPSPQVQWADICLNNPEVLIIMPRGFTIEHTLKQMATLWQQPGFSQLQAVKNNRVYIADGNQYFNRPGPRIVDAIEILAEIINPKQFIFGYQGHGWIKFDL